MNKDFLTLAGMMLLVKRWYDDKKETRKGKTQYKQIQSTYTNTYKNKKKCFELAMSNKLAQLRCCDPKKLWNLLQEGYDSNKDGDISVDQCYTHFSNLLHPEGMDNTYEEEKCYSSCEELAGEFTCQEIREAIIYHIKYHKVSDLDGISNEILKSDLNGYKT